MRKPLIAGNWKMNTDLAEGISLIEEIKKCELSQNVEAAVIVPFTHLTKVKETLSNCNISVGAQNMYYEKKGAFTGEISPIMLKSIGVDYVIIGHSERRQIFHEDDELLNKKLHAAFDAGITPILCCGETLEEKQDNRAKDRVKEQITEDLKNIPKENVAQMVIAYEPIWAIGTGETASADDAETMCSFIRNLIGELYDNTTKQSIRIQYGGSVKPENIKEIMEKENIDGALVGGASLQGDSFVKLVNF